VNDEPQDILYLGVRASDIHLLLDAIENLHEEVDTECPKEKCEECTTKRRALIRLRENLLRVAPHIGAPGEE
jgi:hypothetical protein